jgi:2-methylcitrate dehydratase PrpD
VGLADFTDDLARDPLRRELMAKVSVVPDDRATKIFPHQFPAVLRARDLDGRAWHQEVLTNRGGPARPLSAAELALKFRDNVAGRLSGATADAVVDRAGRLDEAGDIGELLRPVAEFEPATEA